MIAMHCLEWRKYLSEENKLIHLKTRKTFYDLKQCAHLPNSYLFQVFS